MPALAIIGKALLGAIRSIGKALAAFLGKLNAQGWLGLAGCILLGILTLHQWGEARHWKKQSAQYEKLYRGELDHQARIAKQATDLKAKIEALTAHISATLKEWTNAQNRRIAGAADDLRVLGPGKAACPGNSGIAPSAGGRVATSGTGDAAGPQMPVADRAGVPWQWLVDRAEQCDLNRTEVLSWREWHAKLLEAWPKQADNPSK